jgi:crotonobetainyl-CoA:carnitine CoA-transferase CaiB-like acyl-CoA transferase
VTGPPLDGLRIVELASVVAGPSVGKYLSDFGAEVVKVERPGTGDSAREMGQPLGSRSAWWMLVARNKRSVTLNLKHPRGREAFLKLCARADALVESQRPGVLEALDLAPDALRRSNRGLVVVRISGFGQTGPYAQRPGFGTLAEAYSGLAGLSGVADGPPLLAPTAIADEIAGLFATWALMVALYGRDRNDGNGQTIDISLVESLMAMLGPLPTLHRHTGYVQSRHGSRLPWSSPRNVYRASDGEYFAISGTAPGPARAILTAIGGPALADDPRFATPQGRIEHADELDQIVAAWVGQRTAAQVEEVFAAANLAGAKVLDVEQLLADPHVAARETFADVEDHELGSVLMQAPVPRFDATPGRINHTGPGLGADTDAVLSELGYASQAIADGHQEGAW